MNRFFLILAIILWILWILLNEFFLPDFGDIMLVTAGVIVYLLLTSDYKLKISFSVFVVVFSFLIYK